MPYLNSIMDDLISHIAKARNDGFSDQEIRASLLQHGWRPEQVDPHLKPAPQAQVTPVKGGFIQASPETFVVEPGYLRSFSWGYFGAYLPYAFAMKLPVWYFFAPLFYLLLWGVVHFLVQPAVSLFLPVVGEILFFLMTFFMPFFIMYKLSHVVRQPAYRSKRQWKSDSQFGQVQAAWDFWGVISAVVITILFIGSIAAAYVQAKRTVAEKNALSTCALDARDKVYNVPGANNADLIAQEQRVETLTRNCMEGQGYTTYSTPSPAPRATPKASPTPVFDGVAPSPSLTEATKGWKSFVSANSSIKTSFSYPSDGTRVDEYKTSQSNAYMALAIQPSGGDTCPVFLTYRTGDVAQKHYASYSNLDAYFKLGIKGTVMNLTTPITVSGHAGVESDFGPYPAPDSSSNESHFLAMIYQNTEMDFWTDCTRDKLPATDAMMRILLQTAKIGN